MNPADFDKLEGYNPKRQRNTVPSSWANCWARSTCGYANEAWALYKSNPSRVSWVDLSRDRYIV